MAQQTPEQDEMFSALMEFFWGSLSVACDARAQPPETVATGPPPTCQYCHVAYETITVSADASFTRCPMPCGRSGTVSSTRPRVAQGGAARRPTVLHELVPPETQARLFYLERRVTELENETPGTQARLIYLERRVTELEDENEALREQVPDATPLPSAILERLVLEADVPAD
jgi:hypothetical protein